MAWIRVSTLLMVSLLAIQLWSQSPGTKTKDNSVSATPEGAQSIAGDWQGTLGGQLRAVLRIVANPGGGYCASFYSVDQGAEPMPVDNMTLQNSRLHFSVEDVQGEYSGVLQASGQAIRGTWRQPDGSGPLRFVRPTPATWWLRDVSPHRASCISVAPKVQLEVLDWGGTGRALVLLGGLGDTAHVFDQFAPKLTSRYHVYGITRRGFGASSVPDPANLSNYTADRLGDDVLAVLVALGLKRPVLAGHSIAGEELSSIGSRHPDRVAGLVYLDAGYGYAFYDPHLGDYDIDRNDLHRQMDQLTPDVSPQAERTMLKQIDTDLPRFERDIQQQEDLDAVLPKDPAAAAPSDKPSPPSAGVAILLGEQKYVSLRVPILAIFAVPHRIDDFRNDPKGLAAFKAFDRKRCTAIADSFERGVPSARVVRIKDADHHVFRSNEADVIREIDAFVSTLPQ